MSRSKPENRENTILLEAVKLSESIGRERINFELLSKKLGVTRSIIHGHYKFTDDLKEAVLKYAISSENIIILIEALIFGKLKINSLSNTVREKILDFFQ